MSILYTTYGISKISSRNENKLRMEPWGSFLLIAHSHPKLREVGYNWEIKKLEKFHIQVCEEGQHGTSYQKNIEYIKCYSLSNYRHFKSLNSANNYSCQNFWNNIRDQKRGLISKDVIHHFWTKNEFQRKIVLKKMSVQHYFTIKGELVYINYKKVIKRLCQTKRSSIELF